jgi:hypothetical protein
MGASFSVSDLTGVFSHVQEHQNKEILKLWMQDVDPALAVFETNSEATGDGAGFVTRVEFGTGTSVNPNFGIAQAQAQGTDLGNQVDRAKWISHASKLDAVAVWDRDSILAAVKDGPAAAIDVVASERAGKIQLVRDRLALFAVEKGWGRIATVAAISTGNLYFTVDKSELHRFRRGDKVVFGAAEASGTLRGADGTGVYAGWGNPWIVTGVVPSTNRVLLLARASETPYDTDAVRANDTVFLCGYRQNTATPAQVCPIGLGGWVPTAVPSETSFQNIDRRNSPELYGYQFDASVGSLSHFDAFIESALTAANWGCQVDQYLVSNADYALMARDKDRTKVIAMSVGPYKAGFEGLSVVGGKGEIKIVPSRFVPQGISWGGPFKDKKFGPKLKHNGQLVNVDDIDGKPFQRLATSTGFEQRLYFRGAQIVPGPGKYNVIYNLPST